MLGVSSSLEPSSVVSPSVTWSVRRPRSGENVPPSAKDLPGTRTAVLQPVLPSVPTNGGEISCKHNLIFIRSIFINCPGVSAVLEVFLNVKALKAVVQSAMTSSMGSGYMLTKMA